MALTPSGIEPDERLLVPTLCWESLVADAKGPLMLFCHMMHYSNPHFHIAKQKIGALLQILVLVFKYVLMSALFQSVNDVLISI